MEDTAIVEALEVSYGDLIFSSTTTTTTTEEQQRLESITNRIMETLGPTGPGLLSITHVPNVSHLRRTLLPLARKLALLNNHHRNFILKEHNLGSDVPLKNLDRTVSSFARQLKYVQDPVDSKTVETHEGDKSHNLEHHLDSDTSKKFEEDEFKDLGSTFMKLGSCMIDLGLCLARVCDKAIGCQELEQSILESSSAKGRLIHYHSTLDNITIKKQAKRKVNKAKERDLIRDETKLCEGGSSLWQQWHYDYGIFTVLTAPLFISSNPETNNENASFSMFCDQECPSPNGHTYLQILDPRKNKVFMVKNAPESFIVQVGESADILSKGKLRSTLHSVYRPTRLDNLSREMFVVFLQPAWTKTLSLSDYPMQQHMLSTVVCNSEEAHETVGNEQKDKNLTEEIEKLVPSLFSRMKDGMTFAEFSRETTKRYYGAVGLQSKR